MAMLAERRGLQKAWPVVIQLALVTVPHILDPFVTVRLVWLLIGIAM